MLRKWAISVPVSHPNPWRKNPPSVFWTHLSPPILAKNGPEFVLRGKINQTLLWLKNKFSPLRFCFNSRMAATLLIGPLRFGTLNQGPRIATLCRGVRVLVLGLLPIPCFSLINLLARFWLSSFYLIHADSSVFIGNLILGFPFHFMNCWFLCISNWVLWFLRYDWKFAD